VAAAVGMPYGAGPPAAGGGGYDYAEYEYEYEDESARALAVAQAEAQAYLADRIPADAFNKRLELQDSQAIYAMQRGMVLFKYNAGKGLFGKKSDGARIVPRFVQLNSSRTEIEWGDVKTRKMTSSLPISECKRVLYGEPSETFKGFTFRPHADWLCFSVEAQGRTIDFAAQQDAEVCSWVVGLTALLREQTKRDSSYATNQHGVQDVGISRGIFLWRMLEMRMKDEIAAHGFGGWIKKLAQAELQAEMEQVEEYEGDAASAADPAAGALKAKQISFVGGDVGTAAAAAAEDAAAKPHPFATQPATGGGGGGANVSFAASGELLNLAEAGAERTPSGSVPNVVSVVSVAEGGVAHGIILPGDVLLAIGDTAVGPHATHEIATAVIKAKEGVVTLKVRRGGSEQLVTFYKAAAATRTGIALES
jgi:hypothetical protein